MTVRTIQFLTRLSAAVTEEQAAVVVATALDEGVRPLRDVAVALTEWCELRAAEVQTVGGES